ncbi:MAG TPA: hypothetical protein VGS79_21075 [Puia sp.]|nr:hypothetical protein [Puia sp.]
MELPVTTNIALAGDHALNLHALASLLGQQSSFRIISISKDINQLSSSIALGGPEKYPHIVLLDINFDLFRAAGIISFLKASHPDIRLVALGLTKDPAAVLRIQYMGADSYLPKNSDPDELEKVLRQMAGTGKNGRPHALDTSAPAHHNESGNAAVAAWPAVTLTERRYFRLAMSEKSHQDIRRILKLPESTFTRLITALYHRFGVSSRDGLVLALYRSRFMIMDDI